MRHGNKAAFIVLRGPDYGVPHVQHFEADLPRPPAQAYYDFATALDSDDELDLAAGEAASEASDMDIGAREHGDEEGDDDAEEEEEREAEQNA